MEPNPAPYFFAFISAANAEQCDLSLAMYAFSMEHIYAQSFKSGVATALAFSQAYGVPFIAGSYHARLHVRRSLKRTAAGLDALPQEEREATHYLLLQFQDFSHRYVRGIPPLEGGVRERVEQKLECMRAETRREAGKDLAMLEELLNTPT